MNSRLDECKQTLRCVILQAALFDGEAGECCKNIPVPDKLEDCERMLMEIIKERLLDKFEADYPVPVYFAGWLGAYEAAFEYLVKHGLARWRYDDWNQAICLLEEK